ncbi:hypothetical protein ASC80_05635 [Afipia sp. Root123D2]|uniref:HAD hydrolase-like protein n=1 Tax=Afipia sp. Root123D2 TaxID=1736436 RepID=UPI0006FD6FDD|nr:HAD hydrolase-like protein [Afipia sp. Root123D2]KQW22822.1 hypothetical protein ASC80_05635 [Afipia sp. Root123D2]
MQKISIILDIEGTLVDSVPLTLTCWEKTLEDAGYPLSHQVLQSLSGMDGADMLRTLLPDVPHKEKFDCGAYCMDPLLSRLRRSPLKLLFM